MTGKLSASLREAPATIPALVAFALFVFWATDQAGYPLTHWAPGGLIVLGLLAIAWVGIRPQLAETPRAVRLALACLAAYTALSYLSIAWAQVPGDAWEGANRTLLYLLVFALFAGWRQRGLSAVLLLGAWTLSLAGLALYTLAHIDAASAGRLLTLLPGGRLVFPSGYANANAAQWLMAFWPALLLARGRRLPWLLRGGLACAATLLAEVALLSQSRGSLYATPVLRVRACALRPGRTRTCAVLVPVGAAIGAAAPAVLRVGDRLSGGEVVAANVHHAVVAILLSSLAAGIVVAAGAAVESRRTLEELQARRLHRGTGALALALLLLAIAGGLAAAGNPVHRLEHGWNTFKGGYSANSSTSNRLASGLGSNRYDFFRVALDEFGAHPLVGIGADNFQQQYLRHGRSTETPRYPHSVELRTLSETGIVGASIAVAGLLAALLAGLRAARRRDDELARLATAAALAGFGYWVVHGSFDWFWEFAGLGAPAFALLGLACSLAPPGAPRARTARAGEARPARRPALARRARAAGGAAQPGRAGSLRPARALPLLAAALLGAACAWSFGAPLLSELEVLSAARVWTRAPASAYDRLEKAASLNPLSDRSYLIAGSIAVRRGELGRAGAEFEKALARSNDDAYATLELGAVASNRGEARRAEQLLTRSARLEPRDRLAAEALLLAREGRRISVQALDEAILRKAQQFA
ncbi:MAG: O-antigen ligase family protein [Solirubrobacteraceae bacterium]